MCSPGLQASTCQNTSFRQMLLGRHGVRTVCGLRVRAASGYCNALAHRPDMQSSLMEAVEICQTLPVKLSKFSVLGNTGTSTACAGCDLRNVSHTRQSQPRGQLRRVVLAWLLAKRVLTRRRTNAPGASTRRSIARSRGVQVCRNAV